MFERILVPLDGSELAERALPTAFALAERSNAELILLRVPVLGRIPVLAGGELQTVAEARETRHYQSGNYLRAIKQSNVSRNVRMRALVDEGDPAGVILDTAGAEAVDLIIMSTHGRSGFSRWLLGSVTERVLRHTTCPVLAVRTEAIPSHILIPLDGSDAAVQSLEPALSLARCLEARVTLLHVLDLPNADGNGNGNGQMVAEGNGRSVEVEETMRAQAGEYLQGIAATCQEPELLPVQTAVVTGRPAESILDFAEAHEVDLIVMSTHGRSGLVRWQYGSVTEKVMHGAPCSTLIVRTTH